MMREKLETLGEFGLIRRIQQQVGTAEHLLRGIGDDCAIQRQSEELELLTSTDLLIEGIHFDRRWTDLEQLGRKAVAVNVSDVAAMGGIPQSLFLGLACAVDMSGEELQVFTAGVIAETEKYDVTLAGGDTCRSPGPLMISVTIQGVAPAGQAICRQGACVGDAIYVSGTLGDSALALQLLQQGEPVSEFLALRHHLPSARVAFGRQLAERQLATAMLDVSDGLLADLAHLLEAEQLGAEITLGCLPLSEEFRRACAEQPQLLELAMTGGEDYELLFTSSQQNLIENLHFDLPVTKIGNIVAESGIRVLREDQTQYHCERGGFDHFS